jgi:hypothetical protein
MKGLEDDADVSTAELGKVILIEAGKVLARDLDRAGIDPFEPRDRHQQRGFARTRGSHQPHGLPLPYFERNATQDVDARGATSQAEINAAELDDG